MYMHLHTNVKVCGGAKLELQDVKKIRVSRNLATSQAKVESGKGYKSGLKIPADDQTEGLQIQ